MAADIFLLERAAARGQVSLRFYWWEPPAVSLGSMQDPAAILDFTAMERAGVTWIKRPTGGRAVLHWNDLTYSIAFPADTPWFGRTIRESYAVISRCLMTGLAHAGINSTIHDSHAEYAATKRNYSLPCFIAPNRSEIMANNKKLVGSAQKRTGNAVLQHGSLPIDPCFRLLPQFCRSDPKERLVHMRSLEDHCTCVKEINPSVERNALIRCLIRGFYETIAFEYYKKPWSEREKEKINARE
ncbi:MAG: hypothetical protein JW768_07175 [Chitinispirillaceae bacterium]|nr:hypothetical protein [Chitinispirillaceae bacterium]